MNKIKRFGNFSVNENVDNTLNEDRDWYVNNGYITDPSIQNEQELIKKIESEITPAFVKFAKEHNIPAKNPVIKMETGRNSKYIDLSTDNIDDLGVFANVLKSCIFVFFSGRQVEFKHVEDELFFKPVVWSTLNLSYRSKSGGSNGMNYIFEESPDYAEAGSNVWYDILKGEFRSNSQQMEYENA